MTPAEERQRAFVERVGVLFEMSGAPRMTGRLLGWLLIADPPAQSSSALAEALYASKGSISTATRALMRMGLVEKISRPAARESYFRIVPGGWTRAIEQQTTQFMAIRRMAEEGLAALDGEPDRRKQLLVEVYDIYSFFERHMPELIEKWKAHKAALPTSHSATKEAG